MDIEHEKKIIANFFNKRIQKRIYYELTVPEKRRKIFDRLSDRPDEALDPRFIYPFELKGGRGTDQLFDKLVRHGASRHKCYVMSDFSDLDGKYVALREAIDTMVYDGMPFIISCIPGQLAYFEGEQGYGPPPRYLLERKPNLKKESDPRKRVQL